MAKASKKTALSAINKIIKGIPDEKSIITWREIQIEIKQILGLLDVIEFVNDVVIMSYNDINGFMPELQEFAIKCGILNKYTNLVLPEKLEDRYDLVYRTDIIDTIRGHISVNQLADIIDAINKKMENLCNTSIAEVRKQIDGLVTALEKAQENSSELFGAVNSEDLTNLIEALSNGKFDEEKIVRAYANTIRADSLQNMVNNNV